MSRPVKLIVKIVGGILLTCVILLLGVIGFIHTDWSQQRATKQITMLLSQELNTKVEIERVSTNFFGELLSIHHLSVEDRQNRKMLKMDELKVSLDLWQLLRQKLYVTKANIKGFEAHVYKPATDSDSVANYQFVIEAIQRNTKKKTTTDTDTLRRPKLTFDVGRLDLEDIQLTFNDTSRLDLGAFRYRRGRGNQHTTKIEELKVAFVQHTKKGLVDTKVRLGVLEARGQWPIDNNSAEITIDSLCFVTDNHLPRKNVLKPKRGAFDAGHFDIVAKLHLHLDSIGKDTLRATLVEGDVNDRGSGLHVTKLACKIAANKATASINDFTVSMTNTQLGFKHADVLLPSKKEGRKFSFKTSVISGTTLLKDISRPFAPVLKKFTMPVSFQTVMRGNDDALYFNDIHVSTPKQQLKVGATGYITGLKDKYKLRVHFDVQRMSTTGKHAIDIINLFPLKRKFMMKQVDALGHIGYTGYFEVLWKREQFFGSLFTQVGKLGFQLYLDENNKYVVGNARTDSLELGKAMDMPGLGKIAAQADFRFDISKPRTAQMRKRLGGKLPIGVIHAEVMEGRYKKIKVRNLSAEIVSDGAVANGDITLKGKRMDVMCHFSFTNTNEMHKTRIKPGIRFHGLSDADRAAKDSVKAAKRSGKADQKAVRKAARDSAKAVRRAAKDSLKAVRKAAKEAQRLQITN